MKKSLFFIGAVAAMLASCSQEEISVPATLDQAIGFSAYSGTAVTRGTVVNVADFLKETAGIGVFAFYQPANNGIAGPDYTPIKYPTPNFMYNQQINFTLTTAADTTAGTWSYNPVKYWPNNKNDKLSFFAYAPYTPTTTWENLGFSTDATGKSISKSFDIYNDVASQVDYLFAEPVVNMTKPTTITNSTAADPKIGKADVTDVKATVNAPADVVKFNFAHVTSKVNIYVGVNTDVNTDAGGSIVGTSTTCPAQAWSDANTTIEIKSIEFKDLYQKMTWTSDADPKWSYEGKQNIVVKPYTIGSTTNYGLIDNSWAKGWHRYLKGTKVDQSGTTYDDTQTKTTNDEYMFIAPQTLTNQEIIITYVVKTTDSANKDNCSEITNVIKKTWADFKNADFTKFVAGNQYNLYFLIGMQSVKVAATVTDWVNGSNHVLDVPTPQGN